MKKSKTRNDLDLYWRITASPEGRQFWAKKWGDNVADMWDGVDYNFTPQEEKLGFISFLDVCAAHERSAKVANIPCFGIDMALNHQDDFAHAGPIVHILKNVKTTRQMLELAGRYQALHTNGFSLSIEEDTEKQEVTGIITFHPMSGPYRQFLEHLVGTAFNMSRHFVKDFQAKEITFQHRPPKDLSPYKKLFGDTPITFNAKRNTIIADLKYLNLDHNSFIMSALTKSVGLYLSQKMKKHPYAKKTMTGTVTEILPSLMGSQGTAMNVVANSLGLHPKKLQRLLKDEGTSYQDILDDVRKSQAARLLEDTDMSIAKIAQFMDYSSDRPMNIAFKRWYNQSPREYRKAKNAEHDL